MKRSVAILGGTGGIGSEAVRAFSREGYDVCFTYFRAGQSARDLANECGAKAHRLDLRQPAKLTEFVQSLPDRLDVLLVAAASGVWRTLDETSQRHLDFSYHVNVAAVLIAFQASLDRLSAAGGSMIVLTSPGSSFVVPGYASIGMMKAALEAFVRYAASEGGERGVRVNAVSAGLVETKALNHLPDIDKHIAAITKQTPLQALVSPNDIADAVLWLASSKSRMITGQILAVDGGYGLSAGRERG
jgi:NAD(P)-dependent dehydrogenase (short-subunit alcohol dehydrogenase family)